MDKFIQFDPEQHKDAQQLFEVQTLRDDDDIHESSYVVATVTLEEAAETPWFYYVLVEED